jgi:hypothetical protein
MQIMNVDNIHYPLRFLRTWYNPLRPRLPCEVVFARQTVWIILPGITSICNDPSIIDRWDMD